LSGPKDTHGLGPIVTLIFAAPSHLLAAMRDLPLHGRVFVHYASLSSLLSGVLMMVRRTLEGALKCALRDFLREEWRAGSSLMVSKFLLRSVEDIRRVDSL